MSLGITLVLSVAVMIAARPTLSLFGTDAETLQYGQYFVRLISPFYFIICFNQIFSGALRGIGDAKTPTIIMLSSFVVFRQLYLMVNKLLGNSFLGVSLAYPIGWIVCSLLITLCYRRSKLCKVERGTIAGENASL